MRAALGAARDLFGGPRVRRSFSDFFFYFARFSRRIRFAERSPTAPEGCRSGARGASLRVRSRARFHLLRHALDASPPLSSRRFLFIARSIDWHHLVFFTFTS